MLFSSKAKLIIMIAILLGLVAVFFLTTTNAEFDYESLSIDNIMEHTQTLASEAYEGRLTGSDGNQRAIQYITSYFDALGLEPFGEEGEWYQPFSVLMPRIEGVPVFSLHDENGAKVRDFDMYRDFSVVFSPGGEGVDYEGEYVILGSDAYRVEKEIVEGKIVVVDSTRLTYKMVAHIMSLGGKGVLCSADSNAYTGLKMFERVPAMSVAGKGGKSIFAGYVSRDTYTALRKSESKQIKLNVEVSFPIVDTSNILAKIDGRSKNGQTLIISANLDGLGKGFEAQFFLGAVNSATSVSILLETARLMRMSEAMPYETIVFAVWNGSNQNDAGVNYYINKAVRPLEQTKVIHLGSLGRMTTEGLSVSPDPLNGTLLADLIVRHAESESLLAHRGFAGDGLSTSFLNQNVPVVVLKDSLGTLNTYEDRYEAVDAQTIENASKVLLTYLKREIYDESSIDYLTRNEVIAIMAITTIGILTLLFAAFYNAYPSVRIGSVSLEDMYYSSINMAISRFFSSVIPYGLVVLFLAMLVSIDSDANIATIGGERVSNISVYLILKDSIQYLRTLLYFDAQLTESIGDIVKVIIESSRQSVMLVTSALLFSSLFGILRGMIEAYRSKKTSLSALGALVFFSIPDILIVLVLMLVYTKFVVLYPWLKDVLPLKTFILPVLTLSIAPTVYISRITFITIQEEMTKDYIKNEKAKGYSRAKIIFIELLPAVLFKIVDTMPALMTMLLSNMIIVEYLFNYKGILYFLVYLYNRQDIMRFVPLALSLGLIYIVFTGGFKGIAKIINPQKRKGDLS